MDFQTVDDVIAALQLRTPPRVLMSELPTDSALAMAIALECDLGRLKMGTVGGNQPWTQELVIIPGPELPGV